MPTESGSVEIQDELTSFTWSIELCDIINAKTTLSSPFFLTPSQCNKTTQWKLQLYPHGRKSSGYLSLYLCRQAEEKQSSFIQRAAYFAIINSKDEEINSFNIEMFMNNGGLFSKVFSRDSWGVERFLDKNALSGDLDNLLRDGKLTILCCIAKLRTMSTLFKSFETMERPTPLPRTQSKYSVMDDDIEYTSDGESSVSQKSHGSNNPADEFEEMLDTGKSDVTLITSDKTFHAHRVILSSQSSVFSASFEKDKTDNVETSIIDAKDIRGDVLKEVLRSIYIGEANNLENMAHEILGPANKYALTDLKSVCEDIMIKNLNNDNAADYLVLSFTHEADKVRTRAMEFIVENSKNIMSTPGFKSMAGSHANVIAAIFAALSVNSRSKA